MIRRILRYVDQSLSATVVMSVVLTGSIALNLALALKYRAATMPHATGIRGIQVGLNIERIPAFTTDGRHNDIVFNGSQSTLVYVMSPTCAWCARNLDNIRAIANQTGGKYRVVGLSNDATGLDHYLATTRLPFPVAVVDVEHAPKGFSTSITPQMALIEPGGHVGKVWLGALGKIGQEDVEKFFHVRLPGLRE